MCETEVYTNVFEMLLAEVTVPKMVPGRVYFFLLTGLYVKIEEKRRIFDPVKTS